MLNPLFFDSLGEKSLGCDVQCLFYGIFPFVLNDLLLIKFLVLLLKLACHFFKKHHIQQYHGKHYKSVFIYYLLYLQL